jgi:protein angel
MDFLRSKGYEGHLLKKPHPDRNDGPAIFYDTSRFELERHFELQYAYKIDSGGKGGTGLYEKGNCCLIMALRPKDDSQRMYLVANTHLNFNSNRGDIKFSEIKLMTDALSKLREYYRKVKAL